MDAGAAALVSALLMVPVPPVEYDRPYTGDLLVIHLGLSDLRVACANRRALACAVPRGDQCSVILPAWIEGPAYDRVRRHEIGHCNGWPSHHPNGVRQDVTARP